MITVFISVFAAAIPMCLAQGPAAPAGGNPVDQILPPDIVKSNQTGQQSIPTGDLKTNIIPRAINIFLGISAIITFGVFVYAGVMLVVAQGSEQNVTNFKNILIWSLVGLVFITTSYALVRGIMSLSFE